MGHFLCDFKLHLTNGSQVLHLEPAILIAYSAQRARGKMQDRTGLEEGCSCPLMTSKAKCGPVP